jgi:hypothetical protein
MDRVPKLPVGMLAAAAFFCLSAAAQPAHHRFSIFQRKQHTKAALQIQPAAPFPLGKEAPSPATDVEFRPPDRMNEADRVLEANSASAIARQAAFENFPLDQGHWNYQQIACRAFPNHLFLRFTRNQGADDRSNFSVSIPRGGKGHLRVIPVLRRGYSLYSPAPINDGTVAAFNQIRREDGVPNPNAGWLETGLCYAALAGDSPSVGPLTGDAVLDAPAPPLAEMVVTLDGGAIVTFTDQAARPHPVLWTMSFDPKGTLLKVKREPAVLNAHRVVSQQDQQYRKIILPGAAAQPAAGNQSETRPSDPPAKPASR